MEVVLMLPEALQPYAKAAYPFALTLAAILVQVIVTGEYDKAELTTTLTGLLAALVTLVVPNTAAWEIHESDPVDDNGLTPEGKPTE
jgi:hypothetical protein